MNRVDLHLYGGSHQGVGVEVGRDLDAPIRELRRRTVDLSWADGHDRVDPGFLACAHDAQRDLAAVRDQDPREFSHLGVRLSRNAAMPS